MVKVVHGSRKGEIGNKKNKGVKKPSNLKRVSNPDHPGIAVGMYLLKRLFKGQRGSSTSVWKSVEGFC